MCFQVIRIEFQWQSCNYSTTVGPVAMSSHVRPFETVGFTLLLCFICFSFRHNTLHSQSITHPRFALLFHLLSSFPHFSSPEKFNAFEVVKLSSRRHELTVEICHRCSVLPILPFWVCSSLSPSLFSMSIVVFVMIFFSVNIYFSRLC